MEIPKNIQDNIKKDKYLPIEGERQIGDLHLIIGKQQKKLEDIMNFCIKSTGDNNIDISHIRRILKIINGDTNSPMGCCKRNTSRIKIHRVNK